MVAFIVQVIIGFKSMQCNSFIVNYPLQWCESESKAAEYGQYIRFTLPIGTCVGSFVCKGHQTGMIYHSINRTSIPAC